jgi:signal transduction histidine kinase
LLPIIEVLDLYESLKYGNVNDEIFTNSLGDLDNLLNSRIWIVDVYYQVAGVSKPADSKMIGSQIIINEISSVLKNGIVVRKEGLFTDKFQTPMLTVMFPLEINNQIVGAAIMNTPVADIKSALDKIYMFIWLSALLAIILSTFIIYYFSQRILVKPLYEINKTARKISNGEFEKRVEISSKDEIGQLAESFNYMADALQNLENLRRDFIANISHELRSPITSIRGFIQGILDGTIPEDKRNHYLNIVLNESKRLTRLISDVLDLSRLESGEFSIGTSSFDLNELIRLTILRFENEIESKKLNVDVVLSGETLLVTADMDRIGQVISNLIDNAIKFTGEGGEIGISTKITGKKVIVSVRDTGAGIPEDELKLIWDRFHMVDKSRTTKRGTGLGLSIARQIIKQHGEEIWAESKEGEGSVFSFTLKIDQNI